MTSSWQTLFSYQAAAPHGLQAAQEVPHVWLRTFASQYADKDIRKALWGTCRGCLVWMLRDAPAMTAQVDADSRTSALAVRGVLQRADVQARPPLPLTVVLETTGQNAAALADTVSVLRPVGHVATEVQISAPPGSAVPALPQDVTRTLAEAFPATTRLQLDNVAGLKSCHLSGTCVGFHCLRSLQLTGVTVKRHSNLLGLQLPAVSCLPAMRALSAATSNTISIDTMVCTPLMPLLPQLTSLTINLGPGNKGSGASMPFPASLPADRPWALQQLRLPNINLDDNLLTLLVTRAPSLGTLEVYDLRLRSTTHSGHIWQVSRVKVSYPCVQLAAMACLPQPQPGQRTTIASAAASDSSYVYQLLTGDTVPLLLSRLREFVLEDCHQVIIEAPAQANQAAEEALWGCVPLLRVWAAEEVELSFTRFHVTPSMVAALHQVLDQGWANVKLLSVHWLVDTPLPQPMPPVGVLEVHGTVNDDKLAALLQSAPAVTHMKLLTVSLNAPVSEPFPWAVLSFEWLSAKDLAHFPDPITHQQATDVRCGRLSIEPGSPEDVQAWATSLPPRLANMHFQRPGEVTATGAHLPDADQSAALRTILCVLAACHESEPALLCLGEWWLDEAVLVELRGLPPWSGGLKLLRCEWVLEPGDYRILPWLIPSTYRRWEFYEPHDAVLEQICLSAPADRTQDQPLTIVVWTNNKTLVDSIKAWWQRFSPAYAHIQLVRENVQ